MFSYYVCNMESYHRVPKVCLRRFRFDGDDEPLRYAPRTLIVVKAMKRGFAERHKKLEEKVGTIVIGLYFCSAK